MSPTQVTTIKKRDGRIVSFDRSRIVSAIYKAGKSVSAFDEKEAIRLSDIVVEILKKTRVKVPEVEQIQDIVEQCLMAAGHFDVAKSFILYRKNREQLRQERKSLGIDDELELPLNALRALKARHLRKDANGNPSENPKQLFERVARAIANVDARYKLNKKAIEAEQGEFYDVMVQRKFIPGGSYLRNAGFGGPLSNCHVLPIEDSVESIYETIKQSAIITQKAGGGVGYNFSHIRPSGDYVASSGGLSTGPISFMHVIDTSNQVIGMGGHRKAASMAVLNVDHPDILDFIHAKRGGHVLTTFNVSVGTTDTFMRAVEKGKEIKLINPRTKEVVHTLSAQGLFDVITSLAWDNGDPGMLFLDNANKNNSLPGLGPLESTNICGEQWLHPYDVCNLGSINLALMVSDGNINFTELERVTRLAARFMDNGVDLGDYPVAQIDEMAKGNRRIGLGIMGFSDMLIQLGVSYYTPKALVVAEQVMKFINDTAYDASVELAKEKGVFPHYDLSIYKNLKVKIRNAARTSIAPTGSISMVADASSGIEPMFAVAFRKNVVDAKGVFYVNAYFEQLAKQHGFYNDEVLAQVSAHGSVQGIKQVPAEIQKLFVTAHEISPTFHVKMQAAFQKYTDNAISKTINMPKTATVDDVKEVYQLAWKLGCKGVTIYRDGSRDMQVLSVGSQEATKDTQTIQSKVNLTPLSSRTYQLDE